MKLHDLKKKERKVLLNWILLFFDVFFPYLFKMIDNGHYFKDKDKSDVGHVFLKMTGTRAANPEFKVLCLVPDIPVMHELFMTGLAVMLRMEKKEVAKSFFDYVANLRKYGELDNLSELTLMTVIENLRDEESIYAIQQDPRQVINLYINYLKGNIHKMRIPLEALEEREKLLIERIPEFLENKSIA